MTIKELIKGLNNIETGEGEFPLPDIMIDEIIEKLKENEELQELHESYIEIVLDLYDQLEQKNKMTVARTRYWANVLSKSSGDFRGIIEEIVKEAGGEVVEE